eukprot:1218812-Pleurochrysis_carterae.AAC.1
MRSQDFGKRGKNCSFFALSRIDKTQEKLVGLLEQLLEKADNEKCNTSAGAHAEQRPAESKQEPLLEPKAKFSASAKAEAKAAAKAEPRPEQQVGLEPDAGTTAEPTLATEPRAEQTREADLDAEPSPEAESKAEPMLRAQPKAEPTLEAAPQTTVLEQQQELRLEQRQRPKSEVIAELEQETTPVQVGGVNSESDRINSMPRG